MRIISGEFKGKKLLQPIDNKTRPLKDLLKESLFNILSHSKKIDVKIENSNVLDLFSGVGSFGLEALSRGAKNVIFVESYSNVLSVLKKNISNLNVKKKTEILEKDIFEHLNFDQFNNTFDMIFLDPPYDEKNISLIVSKIFRSKILSPKGLLILHRHKKEKDTFLDQFNIIEEKKYGISKVIFGNYLE